jgi:APA family basic amino acid/polyamine antiporter
MSSASSPNASVASENPTQLIRGVGLGEATALNMIDMIGVGPFITIPLMISAMSGPQAMLGWIAGAVLAICDGLVWAELGAAMPNSGGSYGYLKQIYGPERLGRLISFLFIWQLSFSAPLSMASGCIGLARYAGYIFPSLEPNWAQLTMKGDVSLLGPLQLSLVANGATFVAIATCAVAVFLLYRRINIIGQLSKFLWLGVVGTIGWVIFAGVSHFDAGRAFDFPPGAFTLDRSFFTGLGAALLVATYDYWGYYNVCFFAGEVKDPGKTIPRALLLSIAAVAAIYIVMNISMLGVMPWRELDAASKSETRFYVVSTMMQRLYGDRAGAIAAVLVMWTAFASVFSLLLGYSRVPYAAALDGNYFKAFARLHPKHRFPYVSLLWMGAAAMAFCFLRLADVIAALVVIRIMLQFLLQAAGVMVLRVRRPELVRPFRMWLYPAPALLAVAGFLYVLFGRRDFGKEIRYALLILISGTAIFIWRSWREGKWPFAIREGAAH